MPEPAKLIGEMIAKTPDWRGAVFSCSCGKIASKQRWKY